MKELGWFVLWVVAMCLCIDILDRLGFWEKVYQVDSIYATYFN
jgi:hypothetical protein